MRQLIVLGIVLLGIVFPSCGASFYPARLDDPSAVYLTQDQFPVRGDGKADDSAAIQAAIDKVQETTGEGILFVPTGRYRVTRTIYVWPGVRVIGYGEQRPVFVLADKTPGFQEGIGYMFFFAGSRPIRRRRRCDVRGTGISAAADAPRDGSSDSDDCGCEPRHFLFGDEQHRFRDRQRECGGGRNSISRRPARVSGAHGFPDWIRPGWSQRYW